MCCCKQHWYLQDNRPFHPWLTWAAILQLVTLSSQMQLLLYLQDTWIYHYSQYTGCGRTFFLVVLFFKKENSVFEFMWSERRVCVKEAGYHRNRRSSRAHHWLRFSRPRRKKTKSYEPFLSSRLRAIQVFDKLGDLSKPTLSIVFIHCNSSRSLHTSMKQLHQSPRTIHHRQSRCIRSGTFKTSLQLDVGVPLIQQQCKKLEFLHSL